MFLKPLLQNPGIRYCLVNRRNGVVVADTVLTAFDSASRRKGLLGKNRLAPGTALIIAPTNAIHTWFMRFDIDVAFVTKEGRIIKLKHRLRPWRMFGALRAFGAIECPAGTLTNSQVQSGDMLELSASGEDRILPNHDILLR